MKFSNCYTKRLIVVVILIIFSQIFAQSPEFSVTINVTGGVGSYDLTIGFSPDATDGYDDGVDAYAPPQPPSPAFDAALFWENDRYYTQIVNGDSLDLIEHVWDIAFQYPENDTIFLTWNNIGWSVFGTFILQDAFGGSLINIDMTVENDLTLTNLAFNTLKLKVTPSEVTDNVVWPFQYYPNPLAGVFLGIATIDGGSADELDVIAAFDQDGNCAGANQMVMFGGDAYIQLPVYGDDGTTDFLDEGINPGEDFTLKLWDSSENVLFPYPDAFDCWYNNNGAPMEGCNDYNIVYDFRSLSGPTADFIASVTEGYIPLQVTFTDLSTIGDSAIVSWYWDFGDGDTSEEQNPVHLYLEPGNYTVSLTVADVNGLIDTEYKPGFMMVEDNNITVTRNYPFNYPNPVQNSTKIIYKLIKSTSVEILIFNILGKRIRTLVSEAKEEGLNFEDWNSYDDYGYHTSNGVYFYQIRTNYGTDTGKMVLLRNN